VLHLNLVQPACLSLCGEGNAWRWHARLGHLNIAALCQMSRHELIRGMPQIGDVGKLCDACQTGKQWHTAFPYKAQYRAEQALELSHGDLCRSVTPTTPSVNNYFLLLVDDFNHFMWVFAISSKSCAAAAIRRIQV
jgi:hypothetical protein